MKKAIKFIIVIISLLILFILILKQIELRDYKGKGDVMLEKISNYKELNGWRRTLGGGGLLRLKRFRTRLFSSRSWHR